MTERGLGLPAAEPQEVREVTVSPHRPDVSVATVLERAARYIEEFGWTTTEWGNKTKGFCMMGAVVEAGGGRRFNENVLTMDHIYQDSLAPVINEHPARWNDTPGRTAAEVTAALREAARRVRNAGEARR